MRTFVSFFGAKGRFLRAHIHQFFEIGIAVKGAHALIELATAGAIFFTSGGAMLRAVAYLTRGEAAEQPRDFLVNFFLATTHYLVASKTFFAGYLLASATVNLILVAGLYANRRFAYPLAIWVLGLFVGYQLYRLAFISFSWWLCAFTLLDIVVVWLVYLEYERRWGPRASII